MKNTDNLENKISVIIPTMNRPESLHQTLHHISKSKILPNQIIIVDQSGNDNDRMLNQQILNFFSDIVENTIYYYQSEPSLTKARNMGLTLAKNEIIVFSDDDVDVYPETFYNIKKLFSDDNISLIGGLNELELNYTPSKLSILFGMASYHKRNIGHITKACYSRFPILCEEQTYTEWAMGFFFAIRKSLVDKWGLRFDEKLKSYAYAEDLDFTYGYYLLSKAESLKTIMSSLITVRHNVSTEYRIPKKSHVFMTVCHRYYISKKYNLPNYEFFNLWSNIGLFIFKLFKREKPLDLLKAQFYYFRNRKDILTGNFNIFH